MLGELKLWVQGKGYLVLKVNGGHITVRRDEDKPYMAVDITNGSKEWCDIYNALEQLSLAVGNSHKK